MVSSIVWIGAILALVTFGHSSPLPEAPIDNGGYHYPKPVPAPVYHQHAIPEPHHIHHPIHQEIHHPIHHHPIPEPLPHYHHQQHISQPHVHVVHHYHQKFVGVPVIKKIVVDGPHFPLVGHGHADLGHGHADLGHGHHGGHFHGHDGGSIGAHYQHGSGGYDYSKPAQGGWW